MNGLLVTTTDGGVADDRKDSVHKQDETTQQQDDYESGDDNLTRMNLRVIQQGHIVADAFGGGLEVGEFLEDPQQYAISPPKAFLDYILSTPTRLSNQEAVVFFKNVSILLIATEAAIDKALGNVCS